MSDPMRDWGNSNIRPLVPETWVQSPNRLYRQVDASLGYGGPGETRTHNLQLRRLTRYPLRYGSKFVRRTDHFSFYPLWMAGASAHSRARAGPTYSSFGAGSNILRELFNLFRLFQQSQREHVGRIRLFHFGFQFAGQLEEALDILLDVLLVGLEDRLRGGFGRIGVIVFVLQGRETRWRGLGGKRACQDAKRYAKFPKSDHESASRISHGNPRIRAIPPGARHQFIEPLPMLYSLSRKEYAEPLHALV